MVITEVPGDNYVTIDRFSLSSLDSILKPVNKSSDLWEYNYQKIRRVILGNLSLLEINGIKIWSVTVSLNEKAPSVYIGLYKPKVRDMEFIVNLFGGEAEKLGFRIKFYEAFSFIGREKDIKRAALLLIDAGKDKGENISHIPIAFLSWKNILGGLIVTIEYGSMIDTINRKYAIEVTREIRNVIGYNVTLLLEFFKKVPFKPDLQRTNDVENDYNDIHNILIYASAISITLALLVITLFYVKKIR
jgi:hypothetical protein